MTIQEWAGLILTVLSTIALVGGGIKWLTKHYFDEIRAELRPNGGTSLKDQVDRLESKTSQLNDRMDDADVIARDMNAKLDKMYMILLDHVARNLKN